MAPPSIDDLRIDAARLHGRLDALARIGAVADGRGVSRLALTDADREARDRVATWMHEAGLRVEIDRVGNLFGILDGDSGGACVMCGSHTDTVIDGGRFDGSLGVLAALEAVETIRERGVRTRRPLVVADFTNEEGVRFQPDMMGSLVFRGGATVEETLACTGTDGARFGDELERIGYAGPHEPGHLDVAAFVEFHIEQGPILEREGFAIGAVEAVQGISWTEIILEGAANHAGTTPVDLRRDAGLVAFRIAAFARELCRHIGNEHRATVGRLLLEPGAVNVIPGRARLTVDMRNRDPELLESADERLLEFARECAASEEVTVSHRSLASVPPVDFEPRLVSLVESRARALGLGVRRITSGAGHDAQILGVRYPAAMIFVPSVGGISHSPEEDTRDEHVEAGANVLLQVVAELASGA